MDPDAVRARLAALGDRRADALPRDLVPAAWRRSAVLVLCWEAAGTVRLALARRGFTLRTQPGLLALPGGVCHPGEEPAAAAVRETEEELGVPAAAIRLVGRLDEHWTVAGFAVEPFVAWHDGPPRFHPCTAEVAEVVTVDVDALCDPANHDTYRVQLGEVVYEDDVLTFGPDRMAGMTADVLVDLRDWLQGVDRRRVVARTAALRGYLTP